VGSVLPGLLAVALVHGYPWSVVGSWLQRFADPHDPVAHALPLVSGHDLMRTLHLRPSPQVGQLLCQLALAHAQGQISTPDDALALARVLVQKGAA
jgi:tRNA nucleotidyltransferase (CCA-adding enzyme)